MLLFGIETLRKKAQFASGGLIYTLFVAVISCGCNLSVYFSQSVRGHLDATGYYKSGTDAGKKIKITIIIITSRVKDHERTIDLGKKEIYFVFTSWSLSAGRC